MKTIASEKLANYVEKLSLPSFFVVEHPTTFHTYILQVMKSTREDRCYRVVGEGVWPGLKNDPNFSIPASMWKEILQEMKRKQKPQRLEPEQLPLAENHIPLRWGPPVLNHNAVGINGMQNPPQVFRYYER